MSLSAFSLSKNPIPSASAAKHVHVFVAGTGAVGGALLKQLRHTQIKQKHILLAGFCNSKLRIRNPEHKNEKSFPLDWKTAIAEISGLNGERIFVDATGSAEVAGLYTSFFERNVHVITPSKIANSSEQSRYETLHKTAAENNVKYLYETTVGAGLPVLKPIRDMALSGDSILSIRGILSGTLTYLFNRIEAGDSFSKAVISAKEKGYSEPDPRNDLSGEDVARKFIILARTAGFNIERAALSVKSLIPSGWDSLTKTGFYKRLPELDEQWKKRMYEASSKGNTLRYVGELNEKTIDIGVREVPKHTPLGLLQGTGNLVEITSKRYNELPLIVQGPGAGPEVTAAGLLAEILQIAG